MAARTLSPALLSLAAITVASPANASREPAGLHQALSQLTREGRFSGAVVIRGDDGVRFARGYGFADPFTGRPYTPDTPADSGSAPKPMTAAAVLLLARDGKINLDDAVRRYVTEYPHLATTVRQLLAHSAGLAMKETPETFAGKSNSALLLGAGKASPQPSFAPGSAFQYCTLCTIALAVLIERVTRRHYLEVIRDRLGVPRAATLRPARLADWAGRAIGYRRGPGGKLERFDSWEGEAFYGPGNLSISASQLALWGAEWWKSPLAVLRPEATAPARIAGKTSGLTIGNWYCAEPRRRCHYAGHHEGFHHVYYWDAERRVSFAMMTNNTLAPALQQRLARSLVAFAEGRAADARRELAAPLPELPATSGTYQLPTGECVAITGAEQPVASVERGGVSYPAYPMGEGVRYVPGLDLYIAAAPNGRVHWLSLYEDFTIVPNSFASTDVARGTARHREHQCHA